MFKNPWNNEKNDGVKCKVFWPLIISWSYGVKVKGGNSEEIPAGTIPDGPRDRRPERTKRVGSLVRKRAARGSIREIAEERVRESAPLPIQDPYPHLVPDR